MTPIHDDWAAEWANLHPDHPDPRFTDDEAAPLTFHWPTSTPRRARNGRFVKTR